MIENLTLLPHPSIRVSSVLEVYLEVARRIGLLSDEIAGEDSVVVTDFCDVTVSFFKRK